jgi:putative peptide zinc metalloprotease protein
MSTTTELERLQLRPDIEWIAQSNELKWVARDPLSGAFYYFSDIEYAAAQLLSANKGLESVLQQLCIKFPGSDLTRTWLLTFTSRLNAAHLLSPISPRVIQSLTKTPPRSTFSVLLKLLAIPLSVRIPLFNPARLLHHLRFVATIVFHPLTFCLVLVSAILMLSLVLGGLLGASDPLIEGLRSIQGDRWLLLLVCFAAVKSLHEIGHSLACTRFQVDCQEIGLLFLFFTPCLYCDTTDSWKLSSKWQRAAIAAGGMYIELVLAMLAAAVWLTTNEGTLHSIATSVMIVCSVGTLLINANPFLRYDGYYILSDLWGVPNLAEQSRDATWSLSVSALTGRPIESSHLDANIWLLAGFAIASAIYRIFLGCMIMWIAWSTLVPIGLGFIAINIMFVYLIGLLFMFSRILKSSYRDLMVQSSVRFSRLVLVFTGILVLIAFVLEVPITTYVTARAVSGFDDKVPLFAPATAELVHSAEPGSSLQPHEMLLMFDSPEKRFAFDSMRGEIAAVEQKSKQLELRAAVDESVAFEIPAVREVLSELKSKEALFLKDLESLSIRAPRSGVLISANYQLPPPLSIPRDDRYNLNPLESCNSGCTLERGTLVGWFTSQDKRILTAIVAQEDLRLLAIEMDALCCWDSDLSHVAIGRIASISPEPIDVTPTELQGDPNLISLRNAKGKLSPESPHYEVTIELPHDSPTHLKGALASVRFKIASRTIFESAVRYLRLSFKPIY